MKPSASPTPPHQDNYYFCLKPPDVVTLWVALDPVDEDLLRTLDAYLDTGLRRNAILAMGNSGHREFIPLLKKLASDEDPVIAASAAWARGHLEGNSGQDPLKMSDVQPSGKQATPAPPLRDSI